MRRAGVATVVAGERSGQGRALGETVQVAGLDPGLSRLLLLNWKEGHNSAMATLGANGAIVDDGFASSNHLDRRLASSRSRPRRARRSTSASPASTRRRRPRTRSARSRSPRAPSTPLYPNPQNVFTLISTPGGVTPANTAALNRVLASFPDAKIQTEQQFINSQEASINSVLNLLYILLALSIIVSLFGIVNTLVLTVFERTRELGMLRAIGMTRRQTRRMIRHEAVITALLGAALGIPLGIGLAALFDRALHDIPFAVPWGTIVVFVIAAILVGLIAAIFPARRASRLNILERAPVRVIPPRSQRSGPRVRLRATWTSVVVRAPTVGRHRHRVAAVRSRLAPRAHARSAVQLLLVLKTTFVVEPERFAMMIVCWLTITPNPRRLLRRQTMSAFVDVVPA